MGGVDEGVDPVLPDPGGEPVGPPEPADPDLAGRQPGRGDATGERGGDPDAPVTGQALGEPARLGRTPQNKNMHGSRHSHRNGLFS